MRTLTLSACALLWLATAAQSNRYHISGFGGILTTPLNKVMSTPTYGGLLAFEPGSRSKERQVRGWFEVGYMYLTGKLVKDVQVQTTPDTNPFTFTLRTPDMAMFSVGAGLRWYPNRNLRGIHLGGLGGLYLGYEDHRDNSGGVFLSGEFGVQIGKRLDVCLRYHAFLHSPQYENGTYAFGSSNEGEGVSNPQSDTHIVAGAILLRAAWVLGGAGKMKQGVKSVPPAPAQ